MREVEGTFAFRVFHSEWPSTLDAEGNSIPNGKAVEDVGLRPQFAVSMTTIMTTDCTSNVL